MYTRAYNMAFYINKKNIQNICIIQSFANTKDSNNERRKKNKLKTKYRRREKEAEENIRKAKRQTENETIL